MFGTRLRDARYHKQWPNTIHAHTVVFVTYCTIKYSKQRRMLLAALRFTTECNVSDVRVGALKSKHVSMPSESRDAAAHK